MDELKNHLQPLIDLLPESLRDYWWALLGGALFAGLIFVLLAVRRVWRMLFAGRGKREPDWDLELREDLGGYPPPGPWRGLRQLTVYHVPVRLRLVVVAPAGKDAVVDATQVERLLDLVVPGLGSAAELDRPRIRVWPKQLSHHGFSAAFFRRTIVPEPQGHPSPWVLVAGRAQIARKPVLLGLAFWTDQPVTLGRLELEDHQWLDVLRFR